MLVYKTKIQDVLILKPKIHSDSRGFFYENYNKRFFDKIVNKKYNFVQDNFSSSKKNVLRGFHFQLKKPQGKLIKVIEGKILDVFVDFLTNFVNFC